MGTISKLFEQSHKALELVWVAGRSDDAEIFPNEMAHYIPGSDLVGYLNMIHPLRIQILAQSELDYFDRLGERRRQIVINEISACKPPALILTGGLSPPDYLVALCQESKIPLFSTPYSASHVIDMLRVYLTKMQAQRTYVHGVLMDILGLGVLITGESGLGKSELALELISRGHGLVADDAVELARIAPTIIEGRCPNLLTNLLEVRGLGLLDIKAIFGETAVRRKMRLKLIVHLVKRSTMEREYERLPLDMLTELVLGLPVQKVVIPIDMGRNIAVLLEAAVRNTILQLRGIHTLHDFMDRQSEEMRLDAAAGDSL